MVPGISEEAVRNATGHGWDHWIALLDQFPKDLDHTGRAKRLSEERPGLDGWWVQGIVVEYEKARGLRVLGQTSTGDFQASVQRAVPLDADAVWERVVGTRWLPGAKWEEGARFPDAEGGEVVVRAVRPAKLLRFWRETSDGRRIVEVSLEPQGDKTAVRFMESKLADQEEWEDSRTRWKAALDKVVGAAS